MEVNMRATIVGGLVVCASFLVYTFGSDHVQKARRPETTRLIKSFEGPALYTAYCAVCHGADGRGSGPMAKSLKTAPANLTRITTRNSGKFPLVRLEKIILGEEAITAGHGTREMPVWGPIFSQVAWDQDLGRIRVYNLAKFIEEIQVR
jgi:cbb3-type cytochrome c oxidase subunit III